MCTFSTYADEFSYMNIYKFLQQKPLYVFVQGDTTLGIISNNNKTFFTLLSSYCANWFCIYQEANLRQLRITAKRQKENKFWAS
jgi:hypothetical protein